MVAYRNEELRTALRPVQTIIRQAEMVNTSEKIHCLVLVRSLELQEGLQYPAVSGLQGKLQPCNPLHIVLPLLVTRLRLVRLLLSSLFWSSLEHCFELV